MPPKVPSSVGTTAALARHLGLSRWTVSRVLNGHPGVLPETVERVRSAMAEVGFQPNTLARGLRGGRTGIVGVCFQELESPILARKVSLLQHALREFGYHALIELTNGDRELERAALRNFLSMQAEGAVLLGSMLTQEDTALTAWQGKPIIWVDPEKQVSGEQLSIDRPHSMRLVLDHLYGLGHRRFAVLGIDPGNPYGAFRWPAFEKHCRRLKIDIKKDAMQLFNPSQAVHNYDYGRELVERMLSSKKPLPTGIIALNDRVAIGAINRLLEAGLETPRDVSVVGYDNLDICDHMKPTLTTIDQCAERLMCQTAARLVELLADGNLSNAKSSRKLIKPKLIVRNSTAEPHS
ncbi:LacI family DNA-binding transcriptional regulator [Cerasicoccus arenae]|uniref:LacI family DNA-binding transcriptional regulator n=1 Tax=Cerasicoccus arenae TaxID=424488 RepID=UPI00167A9650|nr:LacI family DNA-binding transcriptional regulator [Cerasicoccus arenae]MBK1857019.1 LacI family DNA-binding transcriptional regulator [Cerasicoccus arenae]